VTSADAGPPVPPPSLAAQLRVWIGIGLQSFGGGPATLLLMRRYLIRQRGWIDEPAFTLDWTLAKTTPGITLIGLTALLGRRIGGWPGLVVALVGLLVPAVAITILLAAGYTVIRDVQVVGQAIDGIAPVTIGLTLAMSVIFVRSTLRAGRGAVVDLAVLAVVLVAGFMAPQTSVVIIIAAAAIGWAILGEAAPPPPETDHDPVAD